MVAVVGEALVDFVLEADGRTSAHLGGGPFNAARTLGRLGLRPVFIGRLGTDRYGRALRDELQASGVRLDGVVEAEEPTTFARVELDGNGSASYRFYSDGTASPGLRTEEARAAMPADAAALHVGGLGLVFEPQASAIAELVRAAPRRTLVLLDPNCRPGAVRDAGAYRERLRAVVRRADVVKASDADLAYLEPSRIPRDTARLLLGCGPRLVLLTHGEHGSTVVGARGAVRVAAEASRVVDSIGAGDAFGAAWLAAWLCEGRGREDLDDLDAAVDAARFATAVSARTCERAGADPPRAVRLGSEWCLEPCGASRSTEGD